MGYGRCGWSARRYRGPDQRAALSLSVPGPEAEPPGRARLPRAVDRRRTADIPTRDVGRGRRKIGSYRAGLVRGRPCECRRGISEAGYVAGGPRLDDVEGREVRPTVPQARTRRVS